MTDDRRISSSSHSTESGTEQAAERLRVKYTPGKGKCSDERKSADTKKETETEKKKKTTKKKTLAATTPAAPLWSHSLLWLRGVPPAIHYLRPPSTKAPPSASDERCNAGGQPGQSGWKKACASAEKCSRAQKQPSHRQSIHKLAVELWELATDELRQRRVEKKKQARAARDVAASETASGADDDGESTSSAATESSFGQTWKGRSLATFDCEMPGRFFGIKTRSGTEARSLYLGSRFTAPAEVVGATPVIISSTDAYRSQWFVPDSERVTVLSAALFTTIATLAADAGRAGATTRTLYLEAREHLAGRRQKGSALDDVCRRAAAALRLSRNLEDGGGGGGELVGPDGNRLVDAAQLTQRAADLVVFRAAQEYHAGIATNLEHQRDPRWRASVYGVYPCVFEPLTSEGHAHRHRHHRRRGEGRWLSVTFPAARSVSAGQLVATVAVVNRIAGRRVARRPLEAPAASPACLHIEEPWALALCRASLLGLASGHCGTARGRSFSSAFAFAGHANARAALYAGDVREVAIDACQSAFFSWTRRVAHAEYGAVPASVLRGPSVAAEDAEERAFAADRVSPDAAVLADVQAEAVLSWMTSFLCKAAGGRGRRRVRGAANASVPERSTELLYVILMAVSILAPTPESLAAQLDDEQSALCGFLRNALGNRRPASFWISAEAARETSAFLEESAEGEVYLRARAAEGDVDAFSLAAELAVERRVHDGRDGVRFANTDDLYMHLMRLVVSPRFPRSQAVRLLASLSTYSRKTGAAPSAHIAPAALAYNSAQDTFLPTMARGDARALCGLLFSGAAVAASHEGRPAAALAVALGEGGTCVPFARRTLGTYRLDDIFPLWRPLLLDTAAATTAEGEAPRTRDGRTCPLTGAPEGFLDCILSAPVIQVAAAPT